jgi:hypothetical protein
MTSNPDDSDAFLADLIEHATAAGYDLDWTTPDDLSRRSRETLMARTTVGRPGVSRGQLRLAGEGVVGHAIRLSDLGGVLSSFQRTVSAVGGALDGFKSARGTLPAQLIQRTHLRLEAAPLPGSVVLAITPEQSPAEELYPEGRVPLDDTERPLADRSLNELIRLLAVGVRSDAEAAEFRSEFIGLGPRAASAMRAFLRIVADDDIDLNLSWQEPLRATVQARVSAMQARLIEQIIANNKLDVDEITVRGIVHTISDRRPIELEVDGSMMRVQLGDDLPLNISTLNVGDTVTARVSVNTEQRAGGDEIVSYTLITIERDTGAV